MCPVCGGVLISGFSCICVWLPADVVIGGNYSCVVTEFYTS